MRNNLIYSITFLLFFTFHSAAWAIDIKINDTREESYFIDALKMILDKSGKDYNLIIDKKQVLSQTRKVEYVKKGQLDILYAGATKKLEESLLPIRFPIMRGLIGHRVFIIHKNYQEKFNRVNELNDLAKFSGVQGLGWPDIEIMEAAGLKQFADTYDNIFNIINLGRPYYFSRGIAEAYAELNSKNETLPNLVVENTILLQFPSAVFFFVNRENTELANLLRTGFINAYKDGSYLEFFLNHPIINSALSEANIEKRVRINIPNKFLSPETISIPEKYWHSPL